MGADNRNLAKTESVKGILAVCLHELNPTRSVEQWAEHVEKTSSNPVEFFGGNGEGLQEYEVFMSKYGKGKR